MTSANLLLATDSAVELFSLLLPVPIDAVTCTGTDEVGLGRTAAAVRTLLFFLAMTAEELETMR